MLHFPYKIFSCRWGISTMKVGPCQICNWNWKKETSAPMFLYSAAKYITEAFVVPLENNVSQVFMFYTQKYDKTIFLNVKRTQIRALWYSIKEWTCNTVNRLLQKDKREGRVGLSFRLSVVVMNSRFLLCFHIPWTSHKLIFKHFQYSGLRMLIGRALGRSDLMSSHLSALVLINGSY